MAAALTSGAAALLRQAKPEWTPGQVKTAMRTTASKINVTDPLVAGAGRINVYRAARLAAPPADANAHVTQRSDSTGALDNSRGTVTVIARCAGRTQQTLDQQCDEEIDGEETASYGTSWYGTPWYGTFWYGTSWYGTSWYGTSWYSYDTADGASGDGGAGEPTTYGRDAPASAFYGLFE